MYNIIILLFSFLLFSFFQFIFCMLLISAADSSLGCLASGEVALPLVAGRGATPLDQAFSLCVSWLHLFVSFFFLFTFIV